MKPPPLPLDRTSQSLQETPNPLPTPKTASSGKAEKEKSQRPAYSCAECRRLKLKCSREWPCTSCEKRGCAQICPKGEMRTGKGKRCGLTSQIFRTSHTDPLDRLILANTEELHHRISLLEVALAKAHSESHATPHPLLSSAYLFAPRDAARPYPQRPKADFDALGEEDDVVDSAFGTLTIGVEGEARFVGSFAGSEYLKEEEDDQVSSPDQLLSQPAAQETPPASADDPWTKKTTPKAAYSESGQALHDSFLVAANGRSEMSDIEALRERLPDWEKEGRDLVECYWENVNWMYQILPRPMFDQDHLMNAYDIASPANPHKLACVFLVMAIGVMFDLNRVPFKQSLPETLLPNIPIQELPFDIMIHPHLVIHRLGIRLLVAQTRLLLNRPSFARALKDNPSDPSHSKFGASFVALYESAQEIVQLVKQLVIYHPSLVARWWFFWFHAFSSAVCLSAIAIRAPSCAFASPSFNGMSIVCEISAAAREGCRAKNGLPILIRLRKRAQAALAAVSRSHKAKTTVQSSGDEDDLSHLSSSAKLRRVGSSPPQKRISLGTPTATAVPSPHSAGSAATSTTLIDPAQATFSATSPLDLSTYFAMFDTPNSSAVPSSLDLGMNTDVSMAWSNVDMSMAFLGARGDQDMDMLGMGDANGGTGVGPSGSDGFMFDFTSFLNQA
ncbi:hypothetical protein P7C73_g6572, partial [Tremellales sp. Uapishka_1]